MRPQKWLLHISFKVLAITFAIPCYAQVEFEKETSLHGFVFMQGGQFVNYKYRSTNFSHKWLQKNVMGFCLDAKVHPRLDIHVTSGVFLTYNTIQQNMISQPDNLTNAPVGGFLLDRAELVLHCSPDPSSALINVGIGYWNQKYNHDARDLGEYLFRSGAYPGYIYQYGFDECFYHLAGIHVSSTLFDSWYNEILLTSELDLAPYTDFSVAFLSDVSLLNKVFDIGAGIQWYRCFSADPDQTTPKAVVKGGIIQYVAPNYYLDSIGLNTDGFTVYDTSWYTYAGTKVMARVCFDPKPLLGFDIFGPEDCKIYSEAAILGLKNYPKNTELSVNTANRPISEFGYENILDRIPRMVGVNVPSFKLLDLLSLECEYYGKRYVNAVPVTTGNKTGNYEPATCLPVSKPDGGYGEYDSLYAQRGATNWKWALYVKKTMFNNFSITAQAARDHILHTIKGLSSFEDDREEALVKSNHWYWMLKFSANF